MARSTRSVALFVLIFVAAPAVFAVTDGLLLNSHFEQGPDKSELNGTRMLGRYSIPHWEISGFVEYIESGQQQDDMILPVPEGERAVRLGNDATIRQQLSVVRKAYYSITFGAARTCAQAEKLNISVTPESGVLPIQTVYTSSGWDSYSWAFKAKHSTVWLSIHNPGHEDNPACGPLIDGVAIKTLRSPHHVKNNMLRNGDFEDGPYIFQNTPWGRAGPADHGGRALAAAGVGDHVGHQGRQVRGRGAPRGAARRWRRGAGRWQGVRAGAGGAHRAPAVLQAVLLRRGRRQRVRRVPGRGRVRGAGEGEHAVRVPGQGRVQARRARVRGGRRRDARGVPEREPPHEAGRDAVRSGRR